MNFIKNLLITSSFILFLTIKVFAANDLYKISIKYYKDYPYLKTYEHKAIPNCFKFSKKNKPLLRCEEHIKLLRSYKIIKSLINKQHQKGYILLNIPEFNISYKKAFIQNINPFHKSLIKNNNNSNITGLFKRHTTNIKTYTFKNLKTKKLTTITATPNHRFYVLNKKKFIPIYLIVSNDILINNNKDKLKLICANNKKVHCGISFSNNNIPIEVYNLEVYKAHRYYVGDAKILVHNVYDNVCDECGKAFKQKGNLNNHKAIHSEERPFECDAPGCDHNFKYSYSLINHLRVKHLILRSEDVLPEDMPSTSTIKKTLWRPWE